MLLLLEHNFVFDARTKVMLEQQEHEEREKKKGLTEDKAQKI
jgi:hypothetical protein